MKESGEESVPNSENVSEVAAAGRFGGALLDIGWRLAVAVVVFLWGGNALDEKLGTKPWFTALGFLLVIVSFVLIVRQVLQGIPRKLGGLKND
jgi:nicotinamide riboside transporter PnuC